MKKHLLPLLLLPALLLGLSRPAAAAGPYFHLVIDGGDRARHGDGSGRVSIDVPVGFVQALAALIPDGIRSDAKLVIDDREIAPAELRKIWREVRRLPDSRIATFEDRDGKLTLAKTGGEWELQPHSHGNTDGEFRSIGVADMAAGILSGRPHRASGALALHALEAMEAFQKSSDEGRRIKLETTVERPAMLPAGLATNQLD